MATHAALGLKALDGGNFSDAIAHYTAALAESPTSPQYYIQRSTAHHRSVESNYATALADAELAVVAANNRGKRELIFEAQYRRAVTSYHIGQYANCQFLMDVLTSKDVKDKPTQTRLATYRALADRALAQVKPGSPELLVTISEIPSIKLPETINLTTNQTKAAESTKAHTTSKSIPADVVSQTLPAKIKHDYYQTDNEVVVSLTAKGVPKDKYTVDFSDQALAFSFETQVGSIFDFSLDPLFESIDASKSTCRVTPTKVEFTLVKRSPGLRWEQLESGKSSKSSAVSTNAASGHLTDTAEAPVYPTSSKSGPKNWDKVVEEEGDYKEGDDVTNFFQSIYAGADPKAKMAMMKSYQESNGTVLSTNWDEVGKAPVQTSPPDGMVAKKWGT